MSARQYDSELLSAYALGALDEQEARTVDDHVASCQECGRELAELREMERALGEVPPEAFMDGPPEGGDLLLMRTMRQTRAERSASRRRRGLVTGLAVAASAAAVFYGGVVAGGITPSGQAPPASATASSPPDASPAGALVASETDPVTEARMAVRVTPVGDWVRINAAVTGVPAGQRCRLIVVSKNGDREVAGSWVVGTAPGGGGKGADLDGSAAVKSGDLTSVVVQNEADKTYITVPLHTA